MPGTEWPAPIVDLLADDGEAGLGKMAAKIADAAGRRMIAAW